MNPLPSSSDLPPAVDPWRDIDEALNAVVRMTATVATPSEFHEQLLRQLVPSLAAVGAAVWLNRSSGPPLLSCYHYDDGLSWNPDATITAAHEQSIRHVLTTGRSQIIPPQTAIETEQSFVDPSHFTRLLCPWPAAAQATGVIEILQRTGNSTELQQSHLRFLDAVAELASDFDRNHQLRELQLREGEWARYEQFYRQLHASLDQRATASHAANEGRRLLGCDRVSILSRMGSHSRLLAASGVDQINRRANSARKLEALAAAVLRTKEPLWYGGEQLQLPPQIENPLHDYLDETQARIIGLVPLDVPDSHDHSQGDAVGAIVIEHFSSCDVEQLRAATAAIAPQCALALQNAAEYAQTPAWLRAACRAGWLLKARQLPKTVAVIVVIAIVALLLALIPADFEIEARGRLQPLNRRDIFAPVDGVIDLLNVQHGEAVTTDVVLLELDRPELDLESRRVFGELQTATRRLDSLDAEKLQNARQTTAEQQRYSQIVAQQEELGQQISGLQRQQEILLLQQKALKVRSPMNGQVITWDVIDLLDARPVRRGQVLLTVADTQGPWVLELELPDDQAGYLLDAQTQLRRDLDVTYLLATEPGVQRKGRVESVAMVTDVNPDNEPVARVVVKLDATTISDRRPGTTVRAKIDCGRRSIGFVWFHALYDYARSWLLF